MNDKELNICPAATNLPIHSRNPVKFMFSEKATKIDETFAVHMPLCSKCQIDGEDFVDFCGLLRKHELYKLKVAFKSCNAAQAPSVNSL